MNKFMGVLAIVSVVLFCLGCGDDDSTSPVQPEEPVESLVIGQVVLRPHVDFAASVFQIYNEETDIDSVMFADSLCDFGPYAMFSIHGTDYLYHAVYYNLNDVSRFSSGDSANIDFYEGSRRTTARVKLLDRQEDSVRVGQISEEPYLPVGETFEIPWNLVPNADWYALYIEYWTDDPELEWYTETWTTDTTFVIEGSGHNIEGRYYIRLLAVAGPIPGEEGPNLNGPSITGTIYGRSALTMLFIDIGEPQAAPASRTSTWSDIDPDSATRAMIERFYLGK